MNRQNARESVVEERDEFEMDLQVAARSRVPVLISGSPRCALLLAQAISGLPSRVDRSMTVVSCDLDDCDLEAAFTPPPSDTMRSRRPPVLLLREVHALTQAGQSVLRRLLNSRPFEAPRVFASTSVSLNQRVKDGLFDPDLFYCLNTIHLVISEDTTSAQD
jgi:DNA-binding NtrC family response regulator